MTLVVSDTSPITSLISIGRAGILSDIYDVVVVPGAVAKELESYHEAIPEFLDVLSVKDIEAVDRLCVELDQGEAEAIILSKELHADYLLIDEAAGRAVARCEGVTFVGLIGALLLAKQRGLISSLSGILDALEQKAGFYLSDDVRTMFLKEAGE